jgi:hypothetical protein
LLSSVKLTECVRASYRTAVISSPSEREREREREMASVQAETGQGRESLQTVAPKAPVTYERIVSAGGLGIPKPRTHHYTYVLLPIDLLFHLVNVVEKK